MDDIEIPPLRSLDDFLTESARFSAPTVGNPTRWANRVIDNLLYYQTNYFLTLVVIFLIVGCINPVQMLWGLTIVIGAFFGFGYWSDNKREVSNFKKEHPVICFIAVCLVIWFLMYFFGSILVLVWGIAIPTCVIFIHASLRMRNIKNKMSKKLESLGLKRTPMGIFLFTIGLEEQARSCLERLGIRLCNQRLLQGNEHTFRHRLEWGEEAEGSWYHVPPQAVAPHQWNDSPSTWTILRMFLGNLCYALGHSRQNRSLPKQSFRNRLFRRRPRSVAPVELAQEAKEDAPVNSQPKRVGLPYEPKPKLD